jgi:hypothetical protein
MLLVNFRSAKEVEEPPLTGLKWENDVIGAVDHQHGNLHSRREVHSMNFWSRSHRPITRRQEYSDAESRL